jgi:two-component system sensor histidine kinase/response regulator
MRENRRPLRILLAEDNVVNQTLAIRLLEKRGHSVVLAVNGREAVDTWKRERFDLILMDVQMPEMGGFEATAAIRYAELGGAMHIPIVAMTARAMAGDRESCLEAGIESIVSGPPTIEADGVDPTEGSVLPDGSGPVDRPALLERYAGHQGLLFEIAGLFRAEAPQLIAALKEALARGDAGALGSVAHALRGSACNFMERETVDAALRLEMAADNGNLILADSLVEALTRSVERLLSELGEISAPR